MTESPPLVTLQVANKSPTLGTGTKSSSPSGQPVAHPSTSPLICLQPLQDGLQAMARRPSLSPLAASDQQPYHHQQTKPVESAQQQSGGGRNNGNHAGATSSEAQQHEQQHQTVIDPTESSAGSPTTSLSWEQHSLWLAPRAFRRDHFYFLPLPSLLFPSFSLFPFSVFTLIIIVIPFWIEGRCHYCFQHIISVAAVHRSNYAISSVSPLFLSRKLGRTAVYIFFFLFFSAKAITMMIKLLFSNILIHFPLWSSLTFVYWIN